MKYFTIFILPSKSNEYLIPPAHLNLGYPHFQKVRFGKHSSRRCSDVLTFENHYTVKWEDDISAEEKKREINSCWRPASKCYALHFHIFLVLCTFTCKQHKHTRNPDRLTGDHYYPLSPGEETETQKKKKETPANLEQPTTHFRLLTSRTGTWSICTA